MSGCIDMPAVCAALGRMGSGNPILEAQYAQERRSAGFAALVHDALHAWARRNDLGADSVGLVCCESTILDQDGALQNGGFAFALVIEGELWNIQRKTSRSEMERSVGSGKNRLPEQHTFSLQWHDGPAALEQIHKFRRSKAHLDVVVDQALGPVLSDMEARLIEGEASAEHVRHPVGGRRL